MGPSLEKEEVVGSSHSERTGAPSVTAAPVPSSARGEVMMTKPSLPQRKPRTRGTKSRASETGARVASGATAPVPSVEREEPAKTELPLPQEEKGEESDIQVMEVEEPQEAN